MQKLTFAIVHAKAVNNNGTYKGSAYKSPNIQIFYCKINGSFTKLFIGFMITYIAVQ